MSEKKLYRGITFNDCDFQGRVVEDPQFYPQGDGEVAMLNIATYLREMDPNGQWVENEILVPLLVLDPAKVKVIRDYVQKDRQVKVDAYYKAWENDGVPGHAMVVTKIFLGDKPYVAPEEARAASAGPGLPGR